MAGFWNGSTYYGDDANNIVTAFGGNEAMYGGEGDDQLFGGLGDDFIEGGVGSDRIDGGSGDDWLEDVGDIPPGFVGAIGKDGLYGGAGNDELRFYSVDTGDVANGGSGFDLMYIDMSSFAGSSLPAGTVTNLTMGPNGLPTVMQVGGVNTLALSNMEVLRYLGTGAVDVITGALNSDTIFGGDGDDHLFGSDGDDFLDGGRGVQNMDGGAGFDSAGFDIRESLDVVVLTNGGMINLGAFGTLRNFEAYDDVVLGAVNNTVNLTQSTELRLTTFGGNNNVTVADGGLWAVTGDGDDNFVSGAGRDQIDGGGGRNTARMGAGDDEYRHNLVVVVGKEQIWGEAGNDVIFTGAGGDKTYGGAGNDRLINRQGNDQSYGGDGNDSLNGEGGRDVLDGGAGDDTLNGDYDFTRGAQTVDNDSLDGGSGNDVLGGGVGADSLIGGTGDDRFALNFRAANGALDNRVDTLAGGGGIDVLAIPNFGFGATEGLEIILAATTLVRANGVVIATATGMEALDLTASGTGSHHLEGGDLADRLLAGDGNDVLVGLGGNDTLQTSFGTDEIYGGAGDDLIVAGQIGGADTVQGGNGNDAVSVQVAFVSQILAAGVSLVDGGSGNDTLTIGYTDRDLTFNGAELFVGTTKIADVTGFETINHTGTDLAGLMNGLSGNDSLYGRGGNDTINGLGGDDLLDGGTGNDLLAGGAGNDSLVSGGGLDGQFGGAGDDRFSLTSDGLVDTIDGGIGSDVLTLGFSLAAPVVMTGSLATGATISTGGVVQANLAGIEAVTGFASSGSDVLLGGIGNDSLLSLGGGDTISTGAGDDTVGAAIDAGFFDEIDLGGGVDFLSLSLTAAGGLSFTQSADAQVLLNGVAVGHVVSAERVAIYGGSSDDALTGGGLTDYLSVGTGANLASGLGGDDTIVSTLDLLTDTLNGGAGSDTLVLYGGQAAIVMDQSVPGALTVSSGATVIVTGSGFETFQVFGGFGGAFNDTLRGLAGNDTFQGNTGDDAIFGGDGNDSLSGGDGVDTISGGTGADVFVISTASHAPTGALLDRITDFVSGVDRLDLSGVDANSTTSFLNDTFVWLGTGAFTGAAGQAHYVQDVANNRVLVEADMTGDGVADLVIRLDGVTTLQIGDVTL